VQRFGWKWATTASASALLALGACATHEVDFQGEGAGVVGEGAAVVAVLETPSVGLPGEDAADDPAIWVARESVTVNGRAAEGFVAGTQKKSGLYLYDFAGVELQFLPEGLLNNVDVTEGLLIGGRPSVVLGASDRTPGKTGIALYRYDPAGAGANPVVSWGTIPTDVVEPYGFCFARVGSEVHAILVGHEGELRQFVLTAGADGAPAARLVRRAEIGTISEGCVADEASGSLFIAEENVGLWRYGLDPASGAQRTLVQPVAPGVLVADAEGLTIIEDGARRFLIASSQGDSTFPVWRLDAGAPAFVGRFKVVDGPTDAVTGTDGLDAHGGRVGDTFPEGVVVIQDDVNDGAQNFKYVDWRAIRTALGL
jgi:3-phytase